MIKRLLMLFAIAVAVHCVASGFADKNRHFYFIRKCPVVILETDLGSSTDDLLTLALACKCHRDNNVYLMGVMVDRPNDTAVGMDIPRLADQVLQYYGFSNETVPIGVVSPDDVDRTVMCPYWKLAYSNNVSDVQGRMHDSGNISKRTNDVVRLYRELLAEEDDDSIDICAVGFLSNISNLLDSAADSFSPLNGRELVAAKVKSLRIMIGAFDGGLSHPEYNCWGDVASARYVFENWPGKIVVVPYEVGLKVYYPRKMLLEDFASAGLTGNPLYLAYKYWDPDDGPYGFRRKSQLMWDPMTLLGVLADDDFNEEFYESFEYSAPGRVRIVKGPDGTDGYTEFTPDPDGNVVVQSLRVDKARKILGYIRSVLTGIDYIPDTVGAGSTLRVHSVYSHTAASNGDDGEFIVLTNTSSSVSVPLAGVGIECGEPECQASMDYEFPSGSAVLAPLSSVKITRDKCWPTKRINNGATNIILFDANGDVIQEVYVDSRWYDGAAAGTGCVTALKDFCDLVIDKEQFSVIPLSEHGEIVKIAEDLYAVDFARYGYTDVNCGFEAVAKRPVAGTCSGLRVGRYFGNNLDWTHDNWSDFVITVSADSAAGRHGSVGLAHYAVPTNEVMYAFLPFYMTDGINDAGVAMSANCLSGADTGYTTGTNPNGERLSALAAIRPVLDYATNVEHAVAILRNRDVYSQKVMGMNNEEFHYLISDPQVSVVAECVDNQICVITNRIMTNFYLSRFRETAHGTADHTPYARGIERWESLRAHSNEVSSVESMFDVMARVANSNFGTDSGSVTNMWSEFNGREDLSGKDLTFEQQDSRDPTDEKFIERSLYADWIRSQWLSAWKYYVCTGERSSLDEIISAHTVHTSVYDLEAKTLAVRIQERRTTFNFDLAGNWKNNMTPVYVNGDMVGPATGSALTSSHGNGRDYGWSYDADRKELRLTGNGGYCIEGLEGSGVTVVEGMAKIFSGDNPGIGKWAFRNGYTCSEIDNAKTECLSAALMTFGLLDDECERNGWPRISRFSVTPSNAVISVAVPTNNVLTAYYEQNKKEWNLLSADNELLRKAISVTGSENVAYGYSADNLVLESVKITPSAVELTVFPAIEDIDSFFYKATVR